jgi:hypothetical protein
VSEPNGRAVQVTLNFELSVVPEPPGWIVRAYCFEMAAFLPAFLVEGRTEQEALVVAEEVLRRVKLVRAIAP